MISKRLLKVEQELARKGVGLVMEGTPGRGYRVCKGLEKLHAVCRIYKHAGIFEGQDQGGMSSLGWGHGEAAGLSS